MPKPIFVLSMLLLVAYGHAAEEHKIIAVSEWSKPVESHDRFLRARWLLLEGRSRAYAGSGTEVLLYVEMENANGAWGEPLRAYFDPAKGLQFYVQDADSKLVPPTPTGGSGGDVGPGWITIPYDSTVRLRANPGGWGSLPTRSWHSRCVRCRADIGHFANVPPPIYF
jgi:hypothetical protein